MPKVRREGTGDFDYDLRFFSVALCHNDLAAYFQMNFNLMQHHGYSLEELENLVPWEREVYINLLVAHLKEEKDKAKNRQNR